MPGNEPSRESQVLHMLTSMTNQAPTESQVQRIESVRSQYKAAGMALLNSCPHSRARAVALTELETSLMWAVKSIVLEGKV